MKANIYPEQKHTAQNKLNPGWVASYSLRPRKIAGLIKIKAQFRLSQSRYQHTTTPMVMQL